MVGAVDHDPKVAITQIEGTKTQRLTCSECDWMETAGSPSAATRKKNKHLTEHRSSTVGEPGVPTIYDAIEGEVEMPEGSFREVVPVLPANDEPVSIGQVIGETIQGLDAAKAYVGSVIDNLGQIDSALPVEDPPEEWTPEPENAPTVDFTQAGAPRTAEERAKRLEHCPPHTRTVYEDDTGPRDDLDYCKECSAEAQDWVAWPCPYVAERLPEKPDVPLAVALTKSRIEAQAGPSDADKDDPKSLWHEARARAVSATLAAKLGSAADVEYIVAREVRERLNDARFRGNAYTRWGREREPFLEQVGLERYGIVGEDRLFHARANHRHVCSPDGIAIHPEHGRVALGEYKTSGKELTLAKATANGYIDQIQWQMYVMEADWAVLIWELRDGIKDQYDTYVPVVGGEHIVMRDDERIAELVRRADRFLEVLDAEQERMDEWTSRQVIPVEEQIDPHLQWLINEHLEAKEAVKRAEEALREYLDAEGIKSLEMPGAWKLSYSFGSARKVFDKEAFEADNPGLYEKYLKEGAAPERATLRVTPVKAEDEE